MPAPRLPALRLAAPRLPARPDREERPDRPFTGYKLARPVLSADGGRTGFAGLSLGANQVYETVADASCVWNARHVAPRRHCGCGFYCLHALSDARALGCATANRSALLIEVVASGRYIRYERGVRYSRQRVRRIVESRCRCGRPGVALADAGTGLVGWSHLTPVCGQCAPDQQALLTMAEFAALLHGPSQGGKPSYTGPAYHGPTRNDPARDTPGESPVAVLTAEVALLHARLDELQSRLDG